MQTLIRVLLLLAELLSHIKSEYDDQVRHNVESAKHVRDGLRKLQVSATSNLTGASVIRAQHDIMKTRLQRDIEAAREQRVHMDCTLGQTRTRLEGGRAELSKLQSEVSCRTSRHLCVGH